MNFVLLEELVNKRKELISLIKHLRMATYTIGIIYGGDVSCYYLPDIIKEKLKDIALDECEKELESVEREIERLK